MPFRRRRYVTRSRRAQGGAIRWRKASGYPRSGFGRGTSQRNFLTRRIPAYIAPGYGFGASHGSDISADRYRVKQHYTAIINLATSSGVSTPYLFRGNSVYDPDFTGSGWAATGFSAMANLYQRYLVTGSKCSVKIVQTSGTSPGLVSFLPTLSSSALGNFSEDYASNPWGKDILATPEGFPARASTYMSTSRIYGEATAATAFASDTNSVPSNQVKASVVLMPFLLPPPTTRLLSGIGPSSLVGQTRR